MKIIFAGTPEFAAKSLEALIDRGFDIVAVYTQPDRPAGRGKKLLASEVKQVALKHDIEVVQPQNFKNPEDIAQLKAFEADLMIVAAYGIILPLSILEAPRQGCINIHASLLPRWRGAAPIQRAIQAGDTTTGITIMQMDEGLDTGDMLLKKALNIETNETGGSLHDKLAQLGAEAIIEYLETPPAEIAPEKQDNSEANYAKKLSKQEALLDFNQPSIALERCIRAFNPWPVCFLETEDLRVRVFEAEVLDASTKEKPGYILGKSNTGVDIACGAGVLRLKKIQLPGAKAMSVQDFVNGGKTLLEAGTVV